MECHTLFSAQHERPMGYCTLTLASWLYLPYNLTIPLSHQIPDLVDLIPFLHLKIWFKYLAPLISHAIPWKRSIISIFDPVVSTQVCQALCQTLTLRESAGRFVCVFFSLPSVYVKIATDKACIFPLKMVIFLSYVQNYQRVAVFVSLLGGSSHLCSK